MTEIDLVERSLGMLRTELSPSSADKARLRAALGLRARVPEATGASLARPPSRRWAAVRASGRVGAALGVATFGAGLSIGLLWHGAPSTVARADRSLDVEAAPKAPSVAPAPPSVSPPLPSVDAAPHDDPVRQAPRVKSRSAARATVLAPSAASGKRAQPLETELTLLRRVERAIRNNDPELALALLAELDQHFPDTRLGEERLAARRIAECRLGTAGAAARGRSFSGEHPASVYLERIATACAGTTPATETAPMTNGARLDTHSR